MDLFCEQVRLQLILGPALPHNLRRNLSLTRVKSATIYRLDSVFYPLRGTDIHFIRKGFWNY